MAQQWGNAPAMEIDKDKTYKATVETAKGNFVIELYPKYAPITVNNFVFLIRQGFYDGVKYHRVIPDFVVQGGDPTGTGGGGPGYRIPDELKGNPLTHEKGALSMAHAGPGTGGSQFFIVLSERSTRHLNNLHTVFGKVVEGIEVVDTLKQGDVMNKVTVVEA